MSQADVLAQGGAISRAAADAVPAMPANLTPWRMFAEADPFVQAVMILLALASLLTWAIYFSKSAELARAKRQLQGDLGRLATAKALRAVDGARHAPVEAMLEAAQFELDDPGNPEGVKERLATRLERIEVAASHKMLKGTNILATIASSGPFIGLFGTVWGIMNAFIGIAQTQTTSLAVVAPGIAEALLATALGLVAAIPAVIIYNAFARSVSEYRRMVGDASAAVAVITSRVLDAGKR